ncbi:DDX11 [Mytilus coruscus]|uniref:DDX11 n=1 Tax=Mytilus coruscus TaxID=42192 RepID=A0A6J8DU27_MYTCO|nr:DDX11 [Mytilus coruscus]
MGSIPFLFSKEIKLNFTIFKDKVDILNSTERQPQSSYKKILNKVQTNFQTIAACGSTKTQTAASTSESKVKIPSKFPFPFQPYDIQEDFMSRLYECIELGKIGIFESPTGTGKSLSIICGALKWLRDFQEKQKAELKRLEELEMKITAKKTDGDEFDWISEFKHKKEKEENLKKIIEEQEVLRKHELKIKDLKSDLKAKVIKRKRTVLEDEFDSLIKTASKDIQIAYQNEVDETENQSDEVCNDEELIVDYDSDRENDLEDNCNEESEEHVTKIYFCSRTHSQLSQFVREVIKSPYGDDIRVVSLGSRQNLCINPAVTRLKALSLMNEVCLDLQKNKPTPREPSGEAAAKKKKKGGVSCPYYRQDPMSDFKNKILLEAMDMEQIVIAGKQAKACPYYGTRYAIPLAELVVLPYNTLLHKSTREACGIRLDGNIVIIDEAHNLLETINNIHILYVLHYKQVCPTHYKQVCPTHYKQVCPTYYKQVCPTHYKQVCPTHYKQVCPTHYKQVCPTYYKQVSPTYYKQVCPHIINRFINIINRYRSRLKAKNLLYIKQILYILSCLIKCIDGKTGISGEQQTTETVETKLITVNTFLNHSHLDNTNLFKILVYCKVSMISKKLNGFAEKYQDTEVPIKKEEKKSGVSNFLKEITQVEQKPNDVPSNIPKQQEEIVLRSPLMHIEGFLDALTNADKDGRIVVSKQPLVSQSSMKFLLLNPAVHFADIVKNVKSVIVAGGTMQPIDEFKHQLFHSAGVTPSRIMEYSCGHVIPEENLKAFSVETGPSGIPLDFTFQSRENPKLLTELGNALVNACQIVPGGIVCFFPSYEYQRLVYTHWERLGTLIQIGKKKRIFQEPKRAGFVDKVLDEYTRCVQKNVLSSAGSQTGAILFCVVGGKMSEGINFSDDLGRMIIMVGLPYPNIKSPELQEKMSYLNANYEPDSQGRQPGQVHYENICMKAVNQSIGRAIRHKGDYAVILLLDKRYSRGNVSSKFPDWISKCLVKTEKYGQVVSSVARFFASHKVE